MLLVMNEWMTPKRHLQMQTSDAEGEGVLTYLRFVLFLVTRGLAVSWIQQYIVL